MSLDGSSFMFPHHSLLLLLILLEQPGETLWHEAPTVAGHNIIGNVLRGQGKAFARVLQNLPHFLQP